MPADATLDGALARGFVAEARRGVQLAVAGRAVCFVLVWLSFANNAQWHFDNELLLYRSALVGLALALGFASFLIARRARHPVGWSYPFVLADFTVAAALVFGWQPDYLADYPQFLAVRFGDVLLFVVMLAFAVLPLSRRLPLVAAIAAGAIWYAGVIQAWLRTPDARLNLSAVADTRPDVLNLDTLGLQLVGLVALGLLLTGAVGGARRSVEAAVAARRDRDRLAQFFPPAVLQTLSTGAGGAGRPQLHRRRAVRRLRPGAPAGGIARRARRLFCDLRAHRLRARRHRRPLRGRCRDGELRCVRPRGRSRGAAGSRGVALRRSAAPRARGPAPGL